MEPLVTSLTDQAAGKLFSKRLNLHGIDQVIVGGESGAGFRPMDMQWAREIRDVAEASGCAFFFKQDAAFRAGTRPWLVEADGRRMEYHQFPGERTAPRRIHETETCDYSQTDPFPVLG
jgi:protein gp37